MMTLPHFIAHFYWPPTRTQGQSRDPAASHQASGKGPDVAKRPCMCKTVNQSAWPGHDLFLLHFFITGSFRFLYLLPEFYLGAIVLQTNQPIQTSLQVVLSGLRLLLSSFSDDWAHGVEHEICRHRS